MFGLNTLKNWSFVMAKAGRETGPVVRIRGP